MITVDNITYFTVKELSEKYEVKKRSIREWLKKYSVNIKKVGKLIYIPETELNKFFKDD